MKFNEKIILMGNRAQLGNLLWTHFSARAKFKKVTDLNLAGYPPYFKTETIPFHARMPRKIWAAIASMIHRVIPGKTVSDNLFFLDTLTREREALLSNIQFDSNIEGMVDEFIKNQGHSFLCAIHWRQRDYKYWKNGRYWVSAEALQQILTELKTHFKEVHFIICTDGDRAEFAEINYTYSDFSDPMADILLISKCHCVIGSTQHLRCICSMVGQYTSYSI